MGKQDIMPKINIYKKNIRKERDRKTGENTEGKICYCTKSQEN